MASATKVYATVELGGTARLQVGEISLDSSYPNGGYAVKPSGIGRWDVALMTGPGGFDYHWDRANQKLRVYRTGPAFSGVFEEVPAGVNLSAVTSLSFMAVGA